MWPSDPRDPSAASAVGHDPDAVSSVGCSNVAGTNNDRPDFVARSLKLVAHPVKPVRLERSDSERVLCQDPAGANLPHKAEEFGPEPPLVSRSSPSPCHRGGLAGDSAGHKVDCSARRFNRIAAQRSHIRPPGQTRPVLLEPEAAGWVDLALAHRFHAGPLEAEFQATDAREEGEDAHRSSVGRFSARNWLHTHV